MNHTFPIPCGRTTARKGMKQLRDNRRLDLRLQIGAAEAVGIPPKKDDYSRDTPAQIWRIAPTIEYRHREMILPWGSMP